MLYVKEDNKKKKKQDQICVMNFNSLTCERRCRFDVKQAVWNFNDRCVLCACVCMHHPRKKKKEIILNEKGKLYTFFILTLHFIEHLFAKSEHK